MALSINNKGLISNKLLAYNLQPTCIFFSPSSMATNTMALSIKGLISEH